MSQKQRSAGFVIFRRTSSGQIEYLLLDYGRHWDFAKGHVEKGEDDLAAAIRELHEETGLNDPRVIPGYHHEISYYFRDRKQQLVHKSVVFFLAETAADDIKLSDEHVGYTFAPYDKARKIVTYAGSREILHLANSHLQNLAAKTAP